VRDRVAIAAAGRPHPPRGAGPLERRRAGAERDTRRGEIIAPSWYETEHGYVEPVRELEKSLARAFGLAPVANSAEKLVRKAAGQLVLARTAFASRLEVGERLVEPHACEVAPVALCLVGPWP